MSTRAPAKSNAPDKVRITADLPLSTVEILRDLAAAKNVTLTAGILGNGEVAVDVTSEGAGAREAQADPMCRPPVRATAERVRMLERLRPFDVVCEHTSVQPTA